MNAITKVNSPSLLMDPNAFEHMQRVGSMLALSPLFPDHLRKGGQQTAIANGVLVMNMAARLNEDPLTVAQNIYFVGNKPGWSSSYMIGKANQHGVFKNPISWQITGKGDDLSVTAFAELKATGQRVEATCGMEMAKAEGWVKNAKYRSMPEQMLRYRSATFLIRLYCPEVMIGVPAQVEVEMEMKDVTPSDFADTVKTKAENSKPKPKPTAKDAEIINEKIEDPKPAEDNQTGDATAVEEDPKAEVDVEKYQGIANEILVDLEGSPSSGAVKDFHEQALLTIKENAPDIYADLEKAFEKHDKPEGQLV